MPNFLTLDFSETEKEQIEQHVQGLNELLLPHLTELADGQSRTMTPMGDKSYAFVVKALEYVRQYPEFAALVDVPQMESDLQGYEMLRVLYIPLTQLVKKVRDTMTLAGSRAQVAALTCYGTAKEGRKRKSPNSIIVCNELGKRFPGRSKGKNSNGSERNG